MKQKEIFYRLINERRGEIQNLTKQIDYNNLMYYFKAEGSIPRYFIKYKLPLGFSKSLKDGKIMIEEAKQTQKNINQI